MAGQGFSSLSRMKRKEVARKGANKIQQEGKAYQFSPEAAKKAAAKSREARQVKAAQRAAVRLLKAGFTARELDKLKLSFKEYVRFGGPKAGLKDFLELRKRYEELVKVPPVE